MKCVYVNVKLLVGSLSFFGQLSKMFLFSYVFFFQAEDGIRDRDVTGVQTCALPISLVLSRKPKYTVSAPPSTAALSAGKLPTGHTSSTATSCIIDDKDTNYQEVTAVDMTIIKPGDQSFSTLPGRLLKNISVYLKQPVSA